MGGQRNGDGTIHQIAPNPPIPTHITLSGGEEHQLSWNSALFLSPSLLLSLICTALTASLCPSIDALISLREGYGAQDT